MAAAGKSHGMNERGMSSQIVRGRERGVEMLVYYDCWEWKGGWEWGVRMPDPSVSRESSTVGWQGEVKRLNT